MVEKTEGEGGKKAAEELAPEVIASESVDNTQPDQPQSIDMGEPEIELEKPVEQERRKKYAFEDDPRNKIYAKSKEKTKTEMVRDFNDPNDPVIYGGKWAENDDTAGEETVEAGSPTEAEKTAATAKEDGDKPAEPERKHSVIVNGREYHLTDEELYYNARINLATGDRLEEVKALARELATLRSENRETQPGQGEAEKAAVKPDGKDSQLSDDELAEVIDKLNYGSKEEQIAAARKLAFSRQDTPDQQAIIGQMQEIAVQAAERTLAEREASARSQAALRTFAEKNSDIVSDPDYQDILGKRVLDALAEDLINIGCKQEDVVALARSNPKQLGEYHAKFRAEGYGNRMRDPVLVMDQTAQAIRKKFNLPSPQRQLEPAAPQKDQQSQEREARKAKLVKQPRTASMAPTQPQATSQQQRKSPSDVVMAMKRARGQPTAG